MELFVLNTNLEAVSVIDTYESLIWTDRYYGYGDFEIYTPMRPELLDIFKQDYYLCRPGSDRVMIIEKLLITSDVETGNHLTVSGRSLESILDRRIIWGKKDLDGNLQNGIKTLLNECIISPSKATRKISNFVFKESTDSRITSLEIEAQYTGDNLYDVIQKICEEKSIGFKVTLNNENQFVFELYMGTDRTYNQTDVPYVVFSPKFANIVNSNYIESRMALKNVALIFGEEKDSVYKAAAVGDVAGLDRREAFVQAGDISSDDGNGGTISLSKYTKLLEQRGREYLKDNADITSFEGEIETTQMYKYGEDFFDGDIVQITNEYGHEGKVRVLEIVLSENQEGFSVYPTFKTIEEEESEAT